MPPAAALPPPVRPPRPLLGFSLVMERGSAESGYIAAPLLLRTIACALQSAATLNARPPPGLLRGMAEEAVPLLQAAMRVLGPGGSRCGGAVGGVPAAELRAVCESALVSLLVVEESSGGEEEDAGGAALAARRRRLLMLQQKKKQQKEAGAAGGRSGGRGGATPPQQAVQQQQQDDDSNSSAAAAAAAAAALLEARRAKAEAAAAALLAEAVP